jgi:hypothetical protein
MTIPFSLVSIVTSLRSLSRRAESDRELVNRPLQFQKRSQLFIGMHNEPLSVAPVRVSNSDLRQPARLMNASRSA